MTTLPNLIDRAGSAIRDVFSGRPLSSSPNIRTPNGRIATGAIPSGLTANIRSPFGSITAQGGNLDFRAPQNIQAGALSVSNINSANPVFGINTGSLAARISGAGDIQLAGANAGLSISGGQLNGVRVGNAGLAFNNGQISGAQVGPLSLGFDSSGNISGGNISAGPLNLNFGPQGITSGSFNAGPLSFSFGPGGFNLSGQLGGLSFSIGNNGFELNLGGSYFEFGGKGPHSVGSGTGHEDNHGQEYPTQVTNISKQTVEMAIDTFIKGGGTAQGLGFLITENLSRNANIVGAASINNQLGCVMADIVPGIGNCYQKLGSNLEYIFDDLQDLEIQVANTTNNIPDSLNVALNEFGKSIGVFTGEFGDAILRMPVDVQEIYAKYVLDCINGNTVSVSVTDANLIATSLVYDTNPAQLMTDIAEAANDLNNALIDSGFATYSSFHKLGADASSCASLFSKNFKQKSDGNYVLKLEAVDTSGSPILDKNGNPI